MLIVKIFTFFSGKLDVFDCENFHKVLWKKLDVSRLNRAVDFFVEKCYNEL